MADDQLSGVPLVRRKARSLARRIIHRLDRWVGPSPHVEPTDQPSAPVASVPPAADPTPPPVPLPAGWSREEVYELLASLAIDNAPPGELEAYLAEDFERFLLTLDLARGAQGTALEIGANPYFTTVLLSTFTDLDVTTTNCFDPTARGSFQQSIEYRNPHTDVTVRDTVEYESLNVEAQPFPWPDEHFDVVVFCEVIEHLTEDPMAALLEIHRVLKTGGTLILSTPNVARFENVARLIGGANLYDPYSGYGPFGRHNREFTRHEIVHLLDFCGFTADEHFTADVHPHRAALFADPAVVAPLVDYRKDDLGQYLFARATKSATPRSGRPIELYRSRADVELRSWDTARTPDETTR